MVRTKHSAIIILLLRRRSSDYGTHLRVFSISILKRLSNNHRTSMKTKKILEKHSKIWSRYKDQDESLYLSRENVMELLEGGSQLMYLTE